MMNRICCLIIIMGCCFFTSCQKGLFIAGKYSIDYRVGHHTMLPVEGCFRFDEDSLFTYNYSAGFHKEVSNGKWYTGEKSNEIHIVSGIPDIHNIPIIVLEDVSNDSTTTFVLENKSIPSTKWKLRVNGIDYWFSDSIVQINHRIIVEDLSLTVHIDLPDGDTTIIPFPLWDLASGSAHNVSDSNSNLYHISFAQPINFDIFYYVPMNDNIRFNRRFLWYKGKKYKRRSCVSGKSSGRYI